MSDGRTAGGVRIFVGSDSSHTVAAKVLAYAIRKHATQPVVITPIAADSIPQPNDPRRRVLPGFSLCRFAIPSLCDFAGRGIYVDGDALVVGDVAELWAEPLAESKSLRAAGADAEGSAGVPPALLLLDCDRLRWDVRDVVRGLDEGRYTSRELLLDHCLVRPDEIDRTVPPEWSGGEQVDAARAKLLHYSSHGPAQEPPPWRELAHPRGAPWHDHLREAFAEGAVTEEELLHAAARGDVHPDLPRSVVRTRRSVFAGFTALFQPRRARRDRIGWRPRATDPFLASARIRCLQPLSELVRRGLPVELYDRRHADRYAAVIFSKCYDAEAHEEAAALARAGGRVVFDLCDNHFHWDGRNPKLEKRADQLRSMVQRADRVVASTRELAEVIRRETGHARPVAVVDDAIEATLPTPLFPLAARAKAQQRLEQLHGDLADARARGITPLVWFGVYGGPYARCGISDLARIRELLHDLQRRHPLALTVVSNSRKRYEEVLGGWSIPRFYVEWHPATFFHAMHAHDVAVIPITPSPYTRCKSHNRPAQALALGLPVVADAIPSYEPLRPFTRLDDWEAGLSQYLADPTLRMADAAAGQTFVRERFSLARVADQWEQLIAELLGVEAGAPRLARAAVTAAS